MLDFTAVVKSFLGYRLYLAQVVHEFDTLVRRVYAVKRRAVGYRVSSCLPVNLRQDKGGERPIAFDVRGLLKSYLRGGHPVCKSCGGLEVEEDELLYSFRGAPLPNDPRNTITA